MLVIVGDLLLALKIHSLMNFGNSKANASESIVVNVTLAIDVFLIFTFFVTLSERVITIHR